MGACTWTLFYKILVTVTVTVTVTVIVKFLICNMKLNHSFVICGIDSTVAHGQEMPLLQHVTYSAFGHQAGVNGQRRRWVPR